MVAREIADKGYCSTSECVPAIAGKTIFADKINRDNPYWINEREVKNNELLTPIKAIKGATDEEKQRNKAADDLYSTAVSSVREPVEAFYSWLINKTNIQRAKSAGQQPDCLYIRLVNLPSRSFS